MNRIASTLLEATAAAAIAAGFGFAANALSSRGLDLGHDYFAVDGKKIAPAPIVAGKSEAEIEAEVVARLHELGLQTMTHDEACAVFDDELYKYEGMVFVDARNEALYLEGHVPGAFRFDPYHPEKFLESVVPACIPAQKVVVYCNGGQCSDSEMAAQHLITFGVPTAALFVYVGGIQAWKKHGRPLEKGARNSGELLAGNVDGG